MGAKGRITFTVKVTTRGLASQNMSICFIFYGLLTFFCNQTLHFDEPELRTCKIFRLLSLGKNLDCSPGSLSEGFKAWKDWNIWSGLEVSLSEGFKAWKDWNIWSGLEVYQITNKTKSHVHCCDACKTVPVWGLFVLCGFWHGNIPALIIFIDEEGGSFIPKPCLGNYISYSFLSLSKKWRELKKQKTGWMTFQGKNYLGRTPGSRRSMEG